MTSPILNVTANNATCQLYTRFAETKVFFRHVNVNKTFEGTPIDPVFKSGLLDPKHDMGSHDKERLRIVHYSDAIRLILLEKFGGWYADLDMVIRKSLTEFRNVLGCDNGKDKSIVPEDFYGTKVSNAIFHVDPGT
jgi:hypothetical protein